MEGVETQYAITQLKTGGPLVNVNQLKWVLLYPTDFHSANAPAPSRPRFWR